MKRMKRIILIILSILALSSITFGATLNIKVMWDLNTEPDMASYKLYRTDGIRILINTIPHPTTFPYQFMVDVPDRSEGTLNFVLTAVDTSGNESGDSNSVPFSFDYRAPGAPKNFKITK